MKQGGVRLGRSGRASLLAALLLARSALPAPAQTLASLPTGTTVGKLEASGVARAVTAWTRFCETNATECDVNLAEPTAVPLTGKLWKTLNAVNRQVNSTIKPMTDQEHWGVVDRWDIPTDGYGDCEDYQLLKRKILAEQHGVPRRAMRMTVVIDEDGEGHAVLMVRTNDGDLVLDNKRSAIMRWHETGYIFVKREGQDGREWVSLGDRTSPITTANR